MTLKQSRVSWYFPPTGGGEERGFRDAGIATFEGRRFESLARETIQNSLDARTKSEEPVKVTFVCRRGSLPGREEFHRIVHQCLDWEQDDSEHQKLFQRALDESADREVAFLGILDENTSGLDEKSWDALVRKSGSTHKTSRMPGGSFGIGKHAPFALSPLRTVFYWTALNSASGVPKERLQGKSILTSHVDQGTPKQNVGYFGHTDGKSSSSLHSEIDTPELFRLFRHCRDREPIQGTGLWIPGVSLTRDTASTIACSVIANYFRAIRRDQLVVEIRPIDSDPLIISAASLNSLFEKLTPPETGEEQFSASKIFNEVINKRHHPIRIDNVSDFGECWLYIRVADGLPKKVALIRGSGMLITDQQTALKRFPGCREFAAVFECLDPKGNALLRKMENPEHDCFEPDRIADETEKAEGTKALKRLTDTIRKHIREHTEFRSDGSSEELTELAEFFPDPDAERLPGDTGNNGHEAHTDEFVEVKPGHPSRPPITPPPPPKPLQGKSFPIKDVRIVSKGMRLLVAFTPVDDGMLRFNLERMGDTHNAKINLKEGRDIEVNAKKNRRITKLVTPTPRVVGSVQVKASRASKP